MSNMQIIKADIDISVPAVIEAQGENYALTVPNGRRLTLERAMPDTTEGDFGVVPGTKKPSLFKAGAEKVLWAYGVTFKPIVEFAIERAGEYVVNHDGTGAENPPFFYYRIRGEFYAGDRLITVSYGCCNTREKNNGRNSGYDSANKCIKVARKRAMVDGAIFIGQLSGMFTQDIENEEFMKQSAALIGENPDSPITRKQTMRIYAIAGAAGFTQAEAKAKIKELGFDSTKNITQRDYDRVCAVFVPEAEAK